jgi:isopenicillin N synthase-like dioxygenase
MVRGRQLQDCRPFALWTIERISMADFAPISMTGFDTEFAAFAGALGASYRQTGFAVIADHGIPQALIDDVLRLFKEFFALPDYVKQRYHLPGTGGARGYTPFGVETAKGADLPDLKEFWHVGRKLPAAHYLSAFMSDNVWVETLPGFEAQTYRLFEAFDALGAKILRAIAHNLSLADDYFADKVNLGNSILRVIHYPPVLDTIPNIRAGAHEDINVITLLLGAEEGGLEVKAHDGTWHPINPPPGCLVVNIGDMLQRLSNHVLPSTSHRVTNPVPARARFARYSMPFFLHFNPDFSIQTLKNCITSDNPNRYPAPIMAEEFLQTRLREIKLK